MNMSQDPFILSSAQAHEIEIAMNRPQNGPWTPELVHLLTKGKQLGQFRQVLLGYATISMVEHVINCDGDPFVPYDLFVEEHRKGGSFNWDAAQVGFHLSNSQRKGRVIEGNSLRKELANKPVLNANVLDFLYANPHLIPEDWKSKFVFFWGTVYRDRMGTLSVRFLYRTGAGWGWSHRWLDDDWDGHNPAAVGTLNV